MDQKLAISNLPVALVGAVPGDGRDDVLVPVPFLPLQFESHL